METIKNLDRAVHNVDQKNLVILGDFNINYDWPKDERAMNIAEAIRTFELKDLAKAFEPRKNKYFNWSWRKQREGEEVKSLCDYFLYGDDTNWRLFNMIDVTNFDSDH